ncbi:MAG: long-chain fatty acid--CoA ligase, partial [Spirochaetia bacterium]|nr:long-chain fatty acid--CoA ligase [Spirochaetia bacterium]
METIKDLGKYTFPCLLANSVKKFADRPAVAQVGQKEFTYSEVNEKSQEFSKQLLSLGLSAGSKIAILGVGKPNWGI